jgi:hypothetical protein
MNVGVFEKKEDEVRFGEKGFFIGSEVKWISRKWLKSEL